ncbi:MAG: gliding motility-associated C-terminal domain-containing protein, partial [Candidatus Latescibacteria bacterium]|nr:gliding motility-associated C-terminal domain-containing protein [Candidatus Latescibacterota bacterium]
LGPQTVATGNTPGSVIDFKYRDGWIFPESADESENIAAGLLTRGGAVSAPTVLADLRTELVKMIDTDPTTAFERKSIGGRNANALGVILELDLGARFGVSRLRFFPRNGDPGMPAPDFPFQDDFLRAFEVLLNDGRRETVAGGLPVFTSVLIENQTDQSAVELEIPPQYVRYVRLKSQTSVGFEIAEFQVYGKGFVPTAEYHSDIFDLGEALAIWGRLRWEEESIGDPLRSQVAISTRTGRDASPVVFNRLRVGLDGAEVPWKTATSFAVGSEAAGLVGQLDAPGLDVRQARLRFSGLTLDQRNELALTQADYEKLKPGEKGAIKDDLDNWSPWSPPYGEAGRSTAAQVGAGEGGVPIVSPGPRRYLQFKVEYSSEDLFSARGVGGLSFDYQSPALAEEIAAEISPRQASLGANTQFTLSLSPDLRPGVDQGFAAVEVTTPVRVGGIQQIEVIKADGTRLQADFSGADLSAAPVRRGDFAVELVEDHRFQISFPDLGPSRLAGGELALVQLGFSCAILRPGTAFRVRALPATPAGLPQEASGANLLALYRGEAAGSLVRDPGNLVVQVPSGGALIINAAAVPVIFTPNGDQVNDTVRLGFDLTTLTGGAEVRVRIFDLSGRLMRQVYAGSDRNGRYTRAWDGADDGGALVPPGVYIYNITVDADAGHEELSGTVAVVY